jgi:outer membrane receptor protein involved in Fe transport
MRSLDPDHRAHPLSPRSTLPARFAVASLALSTLSIAVATRVEADPVVSSLPDVLVTTPLNDQADQRQVAANPQTIVASGDSTARHHLLESLSEHGSGLLLNDTQGNPFQPDLSVRGFSASPVLGTPQGVSVYLDGVRVSEVFGDIVNWDLLPSMAIDRVELIPGSDPLFGLNTLGGALSVTTRRGHDTPGASWELEGGSYGRRALSADIGGIQGSWDHYLAAQAYDEDGFGEHDASRLRQLFGKWGYRDERTDATLAVILADNLLSGGQTLPQSFLDQPRQSYTWPDTTHNTLRGITVNARHALSDAWQWAGNAYTRRVHSHLINSNVNEDFDSGAPISALNTPTNNILDTIAQDRMGLNSQWIRSSGTADRPHTVIIGAQVDTGTTRFWQWSQPAGALRDTTSTASLDLGTALTTHHRNLSGVLSGSWALPAATRLLVSVRGDRTDITLTDQLGTALNGEHHFERIEPSLGLVWNPSGQLTMYARYDEGLRTPTPVELTCADPTAPCALPNAFAADPPLKPVIARTLEVGARTSEAEPLQWSLSIYRTRLQDDIEFVTSGLGAGNLGYFRNVGQTERRGIEGSLSMRIGHLHVSSQYALVDARFESPFTLSSPNHTDAAPLSCDTCTDIAVQPGDRLPGISRHVGTVRLAYEQADTTMGLTVRGQSSQFLRGDENNHDARGPIPGFVLVHADASWRLREHWQMGLRVQNLLNRRYASFGLLGRNVFTAPGGQFDATGLTWRSEPFTSVGAPRGLWVTLAYRSR